MAPLNQSSTSDLGPILDSSYSQKWPQGLEITVLEASGRDKSPQRPKLANLSCDSDYSSKQAGIKGPRAVFIT